MLRDDSAAEVRVGVAASKEGRGPNRVRGKTRESTSAGSIAAVGFGTRVENLGEIFPPISLT